MWIIVRFIAKWIVPIGFVEVICKKNDNFFPKDSIGKMTFWRISDAKNPIKGCGILIRIN